MPENKAPQPPERIWLLDMDGDEFFPNYVWCDDPAPSPGMDASDATKYIRVDINNHVKAKLLKLIDLYIVSGDYDEIDQIKQRNKYLEREGFGFLTEEDKT